MFYRVYFISGVAYQSVLWNGIGFLWLLFLVCLIRIWSGTQDVQSIQKIQERFIAEQRFYLKCRLAMSVMLQTADKASIWSPELEDKESENLAQKPEVKARIPSLSVHDEPDDIEEENEDEQEKLNPKKKKNMLL